MLQTLALIQKQAHDPRTVVNLARRQERDLRRWLYEDQVGDSTSFSAALKKVAADVEDAHGVPVEVVTVGDCELDDLRRAVLKAAGEAAVNAAKHSGAGTVDIYAEAEGDDIEVYGDEARTQVVARLHTLRQQGEHRAGVPNKALADFVAPQDTGLHDYVGAFAVTAGLGCADKVAQFKQQNDDYSAILLEALADRLAEAFAERLHQRVRTEYWGYAPAERLDNAALIAERYRGVRPAPGYPACPEHTEKRVIFDLLDASRATGITLTESYAMLPTASVSGWYFAHPDAQYFGLGRIGRDQVADYAARKGWTLAEAERWLGPNLAYQR